jgi:hypothetical protein
VQDLERDFERSSDREINKLLSVNCWGVQGDLGFSVSSRLPSLDAGQEPRNGQEDGLCKIWRGALSLHVVEKSTHYHQWLSEFVTQYWFSMYYSSTHIQSLTTIFF